MREVRFVYPFLNNNKFALLFCMGNTKVLCSSYVEHKVPPFIYNSNLQHGWITAEYNMLPSCTVPRSERERFKVRSRTFEIQRLISRSLRAVCDLEALEGKTIKIDCDVIEADGGTRTCSINGAFLSLLIMQSYLLQTNQISRNFINSYIMAISVGVVNDKIIVDLDYNNDVIAQVDANIVVDQNFNIIELQLTSEKKVIPMSTVNEIFNKAKESLGVIYEKHLQFKQNYIDNINW